MYDIRLKGATVLETDSKFDAEMKLQGLVEQGHDDDLSIYYNDRKLNWSWRAEVSINW